MTTEKDVEDPDNEGSIRNYRIWFDATSRRVDLKETRPNDRSNERSRRYSFFDGAYRIIDQDRPGVLVREFTKSFLVDKKAPVESEDVGGPIDLRLLGIIGIEYDLLKHQGLKDIDPTNSSIKISGNLVESKMRFSGNAKITYPSGSTGTYYLEPASLLPRRMVVHCPKGETDGLMIPELIVDMESQIESMSNQAGQFFEYPRSLRISRIEDGVTVYVEEVQILSASFNIPIDPSVMTWKALNPVIGARIQYNGKYLRTREKAYQWDGDSFENLPIGQLQEIVEQVEGNSTSTNLLRAALAMFCLSAVFLTSILFYRRYQRVSR